MAGEKIVMFREAQIEAAQEFHANEMNVDGDATERAWLRWINRVEKVSGEDCEEHGPHGLGSLDFAYDCWEFGLTVEQYVGVIFGAAQ